MARSKRGENRLDWDWPEEGRPATMYSDDPEEQALFAELDAWNPRDPSSPMSLKGPAERDAFEDVSEDDNPPGATPRIPFGGVDWSELEDGDGEEGEDMRVAFKWGDIAPPGLRSSRVMNWPDFELRVKELHGYANAIREHEEQGKPKPSIEYGTYNDLFEELVRSMVAYFDYMGWHYSEEGYAEYLEVQGPGKNTDQVRVDFAELERYLGHLVENPNVLKERRQAAWEWARSQEPEGTAKYEEDFPAVVSPSWEGLPWYEKLPIQKRYLRNPDLGILLGHFTVTTRIASVTQAERERRHLREPADGKIWWRSYQEVTAGSARLDFSRADDPPLRIPVYTQMGGQGEVCFGRTVEVPCVIFYVAERYTGGAEALPVHSHEMRYSTLDSKKR